MPDYVLEPLDEAVVIDLMCAATCPPQIIIFASILELLTPTGTDKVPGNVQVRGFRTLPVLAFSLVGDG